MRIAIALHRFGIGSNLLHSLGLTSILGSIALWGRAAAAGDEKRRAGAQRLAIFVGLWPPTFFLLGKVLQDIESTPDEQVRRGREVKGETLEDALSPSGAH